MPFAPPEPLNRQERKLLRGLARQVAEIASLPIQETRRSCWKTHNSLGRTRPMILLFPEGGWNELLPDASLECSARLARQIEWDLKTRIYGHEHFADDTVVEAEWVVFKAIESTGWGLEPRQHQSQTVRNRVVVIGRPPHRSGRAPEASRAAPT